MALHKHKVITVTRPVGKGIKGASRSPRSIRLKTSITSRTKKK